MSQKDNKVKFLHEVATKEISGDKKIIHEEYIIDGEKGLMIKYYHKEGDAIEKIVIMKKGDQYSVRVTKGDKDKMEESNMSKDELMKMLGKHKGMKFAADFLKSQKGGKKASKKASKKSSKKASKKSSKKKSSKKH